MRRCWAWIVVLGVASVGAASVGAGNDTELLWWNTATLYQIYPMSFKDSNGDGSGDLKGITQMAGYFKELGVDGVWLSPIYPSPMVDQGYDISDYTGIDPTFGTMQDFEDLIKRFKELDIKVILDFVPNHSSDEHPWFKKSVQNDSDYADFYVWADPKGYDNDSHPIPPNNWFSLFGGSAWEWSPQRKQFYLHQFTPKQPELNFRSKAVRDNMTDIMNFWLDKGIDGFRMDAVKYMYENGSLPDEPIVPGTAGNTYRSLQHIYTQNQPETFSLMRDWAELMFRRDRQDGRKRVLILEIYNPTPLLVTYYGHGNESLMFPFNFNLLSGVNQSVNASLVKAKVDNWLVNAPSDGQINWVVGNHDNPRVAEKYGPEMVDSINLLTGVLPGINFVYYGEEIGMRDTFIKWDQNVDPKGKTVGPWHYLEVTRDPERTPMQWDDTVSAGFSSTQNTWLPVNPNYWWLNVQAQRTSSRSHMKVFQSVTTARRDPVLRRGDVSVLTPDNDTLLVVRSYQGSHFALLVNFGSQSRTFTSQNFFASYNLNVSLTVVESSINCNYSPGLTQQKGALNLTLRPKAAILLTTKSWSPSGAPRLLAVSPLLVLAVLTLQT